MKLFHCVFFVLLVIISGCNREEILIHLPPPADRLPYENDVMRIAVVAGAPDYARDMHFFDKFTGIVATYKGDIYKTNNSGLSWKQVYTAVSELDPLSRILFTSPQEGYAVGGSENGPGGLLLKTTDGGDSWSIVYRNREAVSFDAIAANAKGELFLASNGFYFPSPIPHGQVLKSLNGGTHWVVVENDSCEIIKIAFSSSNLFYLNSEGKLRKSNDNGGSWQEVRDFNSRWVSDITFLDGEGYLSGVDGKFCRSTDNGDHWTQLASSVFGISRIVPIKRGVYLSFGRGDYSGGCFGHEYAAIGYGNVVQAKARWAQFSNAEAIVTASFYSARQGYAVSRNNLIGVQLK